MQIGYARVSTDEQNLDLQRHALEEAGCEITYSDKASGNALNGRKGLARALRKCASGDVLVVWKLDRLGRSLIDLVGVVEKLRARGVGLRVLTGQGAMIDTTRPEGRMIFSIFAALAEVERELISERTKAGMAAARRKGIHCGRPAKLSAAQVTMAREHLAERKGTAAEMASRLGVDVSTLHRALRQRP